MAGNSAPIVDRIRIIPRADDFLDRQVGSTGEVFFDREARSLRLFSGNLTGGYTVLTDRNTQGVAAVEYTVTINNTGDGNKYILNGEYQPALNFVVGYTYTFNQNDSTNVYYPNPDGGTNNQHPLNFSSDNANGELAGGTVYTTNVLYLLDNKAVTKQQYWDGFENASQRSVSIKITSSTPTALYYWCQNHLNMGNTITVGDPGTGSGGTTTDVSDTVPESPESGSIWYNSTNGRLYVYVEDEDSGQWVQPSSPAPTTILDLGISDGTAGQVLTTDGSGNFSFAEQSSVGNFSFTNSQITTDDSSAIVFVPAVTMNSDLTVENDLTVSNKISATNFITTGTGEATIDSATTITLSAPDGIVISNGSLRLANLTTIERNALAPQNGDLIYNTTDNKLQGYQNGAWINIDDGSAA